MAKKILITSSDICDFLNKFIFSGIVGVQNDILVQYILRSHEKVHILYIYKKNSLILYIYIFRILITISNLYLSMLAHFQIQVFFSKNACPAIAISFVCAIPVFHVKPNLNESSTL